MKRLFAVFACSVLAISAAERRAKNVILFIGDATGIPVLNAASIYGYNLPQRLFIQRMPHIGLSDTSSANNWVTDSAAGMTAIVTGQKTDNGVVSETPLAAPGTERRPLKTILEYAEEHGLSTGVMSNSSVTDATPAACYAHVDNRNKSGEIFRQILTPRFGDGVDVVIGAGRNGILESAGKLGIDLPTALREKGYGLYDSADEVPANAKRAIALWDPESLDLTAAVDRAIDVLSNNPKGFFLMVEEEVDTDLHPGNMEAALKRALRLDAMVRRTAERMKDDTLIIFAADHSFDFRVLDAPKNGPLFPAAIAAKKDEGPVVQLGDSHAGEEVLVAATGPGSERVRGFFPNTALFRIMLSAWGWEPAARVK